VDIVHSDVERPAVHVSVPHEYTNGFANVVVRDGNGFLEARDGLRASALDVGMGVDVTLVGVSPTFDLTRFEQGAGVGVACRE
jgi:hypothetical protein